MVERELPKLLMRVRFPLPAPYKTPSLTEGGFIWRNWKGATKPSRVAVLYDFFVV